VKWPRWLRPRTRAEVEAEVAELSRELDEREHQVTEKEGGILLNLEVVQVMRAHGVTEEQAREIVEGVAMQEVRHG
jgi:hypothetical protein